VTIATPTSKDPYEDINRQLVAVSPELAFKFFLSLLFPKKMEMQRNVTFLIFREASVY
jgi:hypothetical protein